MTNAELITKINTYIKTNGLKEITGAILNEIMKDTVNTYAEQDIHFFKQGAEPIGITIGDIWYDTDVSKLYRFNGTIWEEIVLAETITKGNLTEATSSVLTVSNGTNAVLGTGTSIQVKEANTTQSGYLTSTDWNTFNNKQATITNPITGTGTSTRIPIFNGTSSLTSDLTLVYDTTNDILTYPKWKPAADSTTAFQFLKTDGTTPILTVDSTNARIGMGTLVPDSLIHLQIAGDTGTALTLTNRNLGTNYDKITMGWDTNYYNFDVKFGATGYFFNIWNRAQNLKLIEIQGAGEVLIGGSTTSKLKINNAGASPTTPISASSLLQFSGGTRLNNRYQTIAFVESSAYTYASAYIACIQHTTNQFGYGSLVFGTKLDDANTTNFERLRITYDGKFGLSTSAPAAKVHISSYAASTEVFTKYSIPTTTGETATDGLNIGLTSTADASIWNYENTSMLFATNNTERLKIDANGYVILPLLGDYNGDVAAAAGGVPVGGLYRNANYVFQRVS